MACRSRLHLLSIRGRDLYMNMDMEDDVEGIVESLVKCLVDCLVDYDFSMI